MKKRESSTYFNALKNGSAGRNSKEGSLDNRSPNVHQTASLSTSLLAAPIFHLDSSTNVSVAMADSPRQIGSIQIQKKLQSGSYSPGKETNYVQKNKMAMKLQSAINSQSERLIYETEELQNPAL